MKDSRNTYSIIAQISLCALLLLFFGFLPKPERAASDEKKPFRIPSITGFIEPVQLNDETEKRVNRQQEATRLNAIVQ